MDAILIYMLQVNLLLMVIYLGYVLLLKNLTFYQVNRAYFIAGIVFSFVYPFLDIKSLLQFHRHIEPIGEIVYFIPEFFSEEPVAESVFTLSSLFVLLLGSGGLIFMAKMLVQLLSLFRIHLRSEPAVWKTFVYRNVLFPIVPFSFFDKIYVNKQQHQENELLNIFKHEDIHVKGRHTFDILFTEIVLITCWYNPVVWLMRKAVRQNLEFLTDQQVLDKGVDRQVYQYSLLNVSKHGLHASIANQFNFKMLKRRIMMMNKKRSSRLELSKYAFLIPIFVFVAGAFTISKAEDKIEEVIGYAKSTDIMDVTKVLRKSDTEKVLDNEPMDDPENDGGENGFMLDRKIVEKEAIEVLDAKDIESVVANINNGLTEKYGYRSILNITTKRFAGTEGTPSKIKSLTFNNDKKNVSIMVDGPIVTEGSSSGRATFYGATHHHVPVRKDTSEIVVVGHGISGSKDTIPQSQGNPPRIVLRGVKGEMVDSLGNTINPLIVLDGEPLPKGLSINTIDPNDIEGISVLKDQSATALYGEKGQYGVIIITTKTGKQAKPERGNTSEVVVQGYAVKSQDTPVLTVIGRPATPSKPLVIVNGKEVALDLNSIKTEKIESINTLTPEEATKSHGDKGKNGAVIITTKDSKDLP